MELVLTGSQVIFALGMITICIVLCIHLTRRILHRHHGGNGKSANKKYNNVDVLKHRFRPLGIGFVLSLSIILILSSWTSVSNHNLMIYDPTSEPLTEVVPPITIQKPKPKPPSPPPPPIIQVSQDELIKEVDFIPLEIEDDSNFEAPSPTLVISKKPTIAPRLAPPPVSDNVDELPFEIVEQMPMFGGCHTRECSDKMLLTFLSKEVHYPVRARENNVKGRVYVQFIIEKDGRVGHIKVVRGIGAGCDKEVERAIQKMNNLKISWRPGKQRGAKVRVKYTLPVTFSLE